MAGNGVAGNHNDLLDRVTSVVFDKNGTMFMCDSGNRRVQRWFQNDPYGQPIISNIGCWGVALDLEGSLYVSYYDEARVTKWPGNAVVAGGNGVGSGLNQFSSLHHLIVDNERSVFVADWDNHRVMKWSAGAKEGVVVAGGNGQGDDMNQLNQPIAVAVDQMGTVYVLENGNHRVTRWFKGAKSGSVIIGGVGAGSRNDQLLSPHGLTLDREGNLYVADTSNHRVQMFAIDKSTCT